MRRHLAVGMMARFFGCVICGIALSTGFLGAATFWRPYDPLDTWADVRHDVIVIGLIGVIAGAIVGTLWSLLWSIDLWLGPPKPRP
jgi:ABC-type transport system involved in cytochrome c biogenesis permease subunit